MTDNSPLADINRSLHLDVGNSLLKLSQAYLTLAVKVLDNEPLTIEERDLCCDILFEIELDKDV